jgi:hypothetical protein
MNEKPELVWERLNAVREGKRMLDIEWEIHRTPVPGGWLVLVRVEGDITPGIAFYPDPEHKWDGGSLRLKQKGEP